MKKKTALLGLFTFGSIFILFFLKVSSFFYARDQIFALFLNILVLFFLITYWRIRDDFKEIFSPQFSRSEGGEFSEDLKYLQRGIISFIIAGLLIDIFLLTLLFLFGSSDFFLLFSRMIASLEFSLLAALFYFGAFIASIVLMFYISIKFYRINKIISKYTKIQKFQKAGWWYLSLFFIWPGLFLLTFILAVMGIPLRDVVPLKVLSFLAIYTPIFLGTFLFISAFWKVLRAESV